MDFLCFQKYPQDFFLQHHPSTYKILTSMTNTWNLLFLQAWNILRWARVTEFVILNSQHFFSCTWYCKQKLQNQKILLLPCIYRYISSFTLKLITAFPQKLAIFDVWNVKQKDDGTDQNTLRCCYDE